MVQMSLSDDSKECNEFKNKFRLSFFKTENFQEKLLQRLGVVEWTTEDGENLGGKLTFKHSVVNKKTFYEINHHLSHHTRAL